MTINILYFITFLLLIGVIIEKIRSWKLLLMAIIGILSLILNLTDLIDFDLLYARVISISLLIITAHRFFLVSSIKRWDLDDEL